MLLNLYCPQNVTQLAIRIIISSSYLFKVYGTFISVMLESSICETNLLHLIYYKCKQDYMNVVFIYKYFLIGFGIERYFVVDRNTFSRNTYNDCGYEFVSWLTFMSIVVSYITQLVTWSILTANK